MTLPQQTKSKIIAEARKYASDKEPNDDYVDNALCSYAAGATEWTGKAQPAIDALDELLKQLPKGDTLNFYFAKEQVIKAREELAKYKEVGNGG